MNARFDSVVDEKWNESCSLSARVLRQWSAPGVIVAVTNLADEESVLFHCIRQAKRSPAKVLLVHVMQAENRRSDRRERPRSAELRGMGESALVALRRMTRQLQWVGIPCEPLLLTGSPLTEIPLAVVAHGADRLLMAADCENGADGTALQSLAEELLPGISIPICTVRRCFAAAPVRLTRSAKITLAVGLHSAAAMPLAFASRLAQEHRATLTVLPVLSPEEARREIERSPSAVASQLPVDTLREAELMCPLEIAIRKGDPATEILNSGSCTDQDFIVLGPLGQPRAFPTTTSSIVHRVISEALCPVIVLGRCLGDAALAQGEAN